MSINIPRWIDQNITPATIAGVNQGGCESGAYMPAVTYHTAKEIMCEHGDDVIDYIADVIIDDMPNNVETWGQICVYYLSLAVETWCYANEHLADWENEEPVADMEDSE